MATTIQSGAWPAHAASSHRSTTIDAVCLALLVLLPAIAYLPQLGFYSDDWFLLSRAQSAASEGWVQAVELAVTDVFAARPGHGLYTAFLYALFGLDPLGHHLFNSGILSAGFVLLYLLLIRLGAGRLDAFAICAIAAVLPQFSTVRVWFSSFQIPLSMLFFLISAHCQLSYLQRRRIGWIALAALAALSSIACYEISAPLMAAFPVALVAVRVTERGAIERNRDWKTLAQLLAVPAALALALLLKASVSDRTGPADPMHYLSLAYRLVRPDYDWTVDSGLNIYAALSVNFWHPILGWAKAGGALLSGSLAPQVAGLGIIGAALAYWRLSGRAAAEPKRIEPRLLVGSGLLVFALGLAIFLIVPAIIFSPSGLGNRVLPAAAIGVAIVFWGALRFVASKQPADSGRKLLPVALCMLVALGVARTAEIGGYWGEASRAQDNILSAARSDLKALPAGATVILDGVCPYQGPGVVFETHWDTAFALGLAAGKDLRGDVAGERMRLTPTGLETSIYGKPAHYAYGPSLFAYDPNLPSLVRLPNAATARDYFRATAKRRQCPRSYVGHGVLI